jgi:hypothetical protein
LNLLRSTIYRSRVTASTAFCLLAACHVVLLTRCSTDGATGAGDKAPGGRVQVSGTTSDEDPTEFKQADESVQIGGVNLAGDQNLSSRYIIRAYLVTPSRDILIYSGTSSTSQFKFAIKSVTTYVRIDVTDPLGKTKSALLPPAFNYTTTNAKVAVNNVSDVAAKLLTITASKARYGDQAANQVLNQFSISVADLLMSASSALRVVDEQQKLGVAADPVDLTNLTSNLISASASKVSALGSEMSALRYAQHISDASYETVYSTDAESINPQVLAYRTNGNPGSSSAATQDVAYVAVKNTANRFLEAAFRVLSTALRTASTTAVAASETTASTVSMTYSALYSSCLTVTTCMASSYTPPAPPSSSGGGTTGGSTGDSTGGSTGGSSGGTTGGSSPLAINSVTKLTEVYVMAAFGGGTGAATYTVTAYSNAACTVAVGTPASGSASPLTVNLGAGNGANYYLKVTGAAQSSTCAGPYSTTTFGLNP